LRTVAHLSDLHFGRIDAPVLDALRRRLAGLAPDLVVVSGDLTQRARRREFREARAYLDSLPKPQLVVPGNHDVPLYDVFQRFFRPLARYQGIIAGEVEPAFVDEELAVVGVNTARALALKGGRIGEKQLARVRETLCRCGGEVTKIVVTHHPLELRGCGADVLLCGHHHAAHAGPALAPPGAPGPSALVVQAGTATSKRRRGEPNSFNLLRIVPRRIEVVAYVLEGGDFAGAATQAFEHRGGIWVRGCA